MTGRRLAAAVLALVVAVLVSCGGGVSGNPDELLASGWRAYSTGDWDVATHAFEAVEQNRSVTQDQLMSALLGLAVTYHYSSEPDRDRAATYYARLNSVSSETAHRLGMLGLAQVSRADPASRQEALALLEQIRRDYPDSVEADESVLETVEILMAPVSDKESVGGFALPPGTDLDRAAALLQEWVARRPDSPLAATMQRLLAHGCLIRKDYQGVVQHLQTALDKGIISAETTSGTLWQVARIAEMELKDYGLAEKYYAKFVETSRRHALYYRATLSLDRVRKLRAGQAG